jgi:tetratricopeptide (TPR) repeat protein
MENTMNTSRKAILPLFVALVLCATPVAYGKVESPQRPQTQEQVRMALGFLDKLLTVSSLARHIESRNFAPAIAYLEEARKLQAQATVSLNENNLVLAIAKRDEAIRLAFEAGHLSQRASDDQNKPKNDYESRLRSIQALTTAYESITRKSGRPELSMQLSKQVEEDLAIAERLRAEANYVAGRAELDKAYLVIRNAVEQVRGGQTLGELSSSGTSSSPRQHDYETKLRSIHALLDAQQRIADEKSSIEHKQQLKRTVTALLNSAQDYAASNEYETALKTVKQAYQIVTTSIEQLRGGETLVRTLHFETQEEEYHYELDRNDTYHMLIHMLVEDKKTMEITDRIQQFLDQSNALRKLAERQAENGDFDTAIKSLEQSTRNLIFAMRNAGFFIPG